jgi:hypothetical protein
MKDNLLSDVKIKQFASNESEKILHMLGILKSDKDYSIKKFELYNKIYKAIKEINQPIQKNDKETQSLIDNIIYF